MDERIKQWLVLGREHYAKRELDKAEQMFRQVLAEEDRFADVHDILGLISHARGNFIAAEHHFERALAINPNYTEAALNLAVTYNDHGKYDKARELYTRIRARPDGTSAEGLDPFVRGKIANMHADLSQAYNDVGLRYEAIEELRRATLLCPQFADLRSRLGALLRESGDLAGARREYEAAIASRGSYVPAHLQLGVTLLSLGATQLAEAAWHKVLELEPENVQAKMYLRMLKNRPESLPPRA